MLKMSKKKKILLKKLGLSSDKTNLISDMMCDTIQDVKKDTPRIVCVKTLSNFSWDINGSNVLFLKNKEYIMPIGLFFKHRKDNNKQEVFKPTKKTFKDIFNRYDGQDLTNKTLLMWRFGGIGDLMFAQPLIKYLKSKYPTCKIIFATAPRNKVIFGSWPKGLVYKTDNMPFAKSLMDEADYHLTFEGSIERCKEAHTKPSHDVFKEMAGVDFDVKDYPVELVPNADIYNKMKNIIPPNTVAIQIQASSVLRNLPIPNVVNIMAKLSEKGYLPGIIDSKKEATDIDIFVENLKNAGVTAINLAKYSDTLEHCIAILNCCTGVIATDSAMTHMAAGLNKPVVGLYGPFRGEILMVHYKTGDWVNGSDGWNACGKAPCYYHDNNKKNCPYIASNQPPGCLQSIKTEEVIEKFERLVEMYGTKPDVPDPEPIKEETDNVDHV
jgi:ADP-heptose:LPS heptosyltransferase